MKEHALFTRLRSLGRRRLWERATLILAGVWFAAALVSSGILLGLRSLGVPTLIPTLILAATGLLVGIYSAGRTLRQPPNTRGAAQDIETRFPDLKGLVLTAAQQEPALDGSYGFFQQRILDEAIDHDRRNDWRSAVPPTRLIAFQALQCIALAGFVAALLIAPRTALSSRRTGSDLALSKLGSGLEITPGDTTLERGSSLVVLARFGGAPPRSAELVVTGTNGASTSTHRLPLVRNLADALFGGAVSDVTTNFTYRVEYDQQRSGEFHVTVFEYPRLERSSVDLTFPSYTAKPVKHIEDTRRVTAVEGSRLELALQLNKPVAAARLNPRTTNLPSITLTIDSNRPNATLSGFLLEKSATYDLQLVDQEGRTNRIGAQFVFEVPPNRLPELKLAMPRGDVRPSPLEEITFEGTVWDDFGIAAYGLGFVRVGQDPQYLELGKTVAGGEKQPFHHLLALEALAAKPDQVLGWFVWADDTGPDGQIRRTAGDIFFAEVRPFEAIFRESEGAGGEGGEGGKSGDGDSPTRHLAELQKQIITATWKLQSRPRTPPVRSSGGAPERPPATTPAAKPAASFRGLTPHNLESWAAIPQFFGQPAPRKAAEKNTSEPARKSVRPAVAPATGRYEDDLVVVKDAAEQALNQARSQLEKQTDPRQQALWEAAIAQMERAVAQLEKAAASPTSLPAALEAEQAAYEAVLKLQTRETEVTRSKKGKGKGSQSGQQQRELEELDLTQSEDRYETQRQARSPANNERREQLQSLNRLQELARRQQDVNERLKELQTALQAAADEKKKEELRRQLKRLQEEERQNLADADELQQRMNRPENQAQTGEQRRRLEETRNEMQKAADATGEGQISQALAAGTRAQRQLQDLREDLRKQNANEFNEGIRELRNDARELARQEAEIKRQLDQPEDPRHRSLSEDGAHQQLLDKLSAQQGRLTNLVERATRLSEQAETSEPLLARQLEETLRKFSQEDLDNLKKMREQLVRQGEMTRGLNQQLDQTAKDSGAKSLELTRQLLRQGMAGPARAAEQKARAGIESLRQGVDRAAGTVLGDDTEALRLAQQELEELSRQLTQEMAANRSATNNSPRDATAASQTNQLAAASRASTPNGEPIPGSSEDSTQTNTIEGGDQAANSPGSTPGTTPGQKPSASPGKAPGKGAPSPTGTQSGGKPTAPETASAAPESGGNPGQAETPGPSDQPGQAGQAGQAGPKGQPGQPGKTGQPGTGDQPGSPGASGQPVPSEQAAATPGQGGQGGQPGPGAQGNPATRGTPPRNPGQRPGQRPGQPGTPGGPGGGFDLGALLDGSNEATSHGGGGPSGGPLTGEDFAGWSDRLRNVEDLLDAPDLRAGVADARDQARRMRVDFRKDRQKPDWAVVELQVLRPLVEVRDQIREELARRAAVDPLVPLDRDPVPGKYSELVRRYYEELGRDKKP